MLRKDVRDIEAMFGDDAFAVLRKSEEFAVPSEKFVFALTETLEQSPSDFSCRFCIKFDNKRVFADSKASILWRWASSSRLLSSLSEMCDLKIIELKLYITLTI